MTNANQSCQEMVLPFSVKAKTQHRHGSYDSKLCPERLTKDAMPNTYDPELQDPYSEHTLFLFAGGNRFEGEEVYPEVLSTSAPGSVVLIEEVRGEDGSRTIEGKQAKEAATFDAMQDPAVQVIENPRIGSYFENLVCISRGEEPRDLDPARTSEPDILVRGPLLASGEYSWLPVDVKDAKVTSGSAKPKSYLASPLSRLEGILDTLAAVSEMDGATFKDRVEIFTEGEVSVGAQDRAIQIGGSLKLEHWQQLAHYYRHLQSLGLAAPTAWGAIIGRERVAVWSLLDLEQFIKIDRIEGRVTKSALDVYDKAFANAQAVYNNAVARDEDPSVPALSFPEWKETCKECPWRTVCLEELSTSPDGGHITLLPGVTPIRAKSHYEAGVTQIGQLARLDISTAKAVDGLTDLAAQVAKETKVTKAEALETLVAQTAGRDATTWKYAQYNVWELERSIYQARVARFGKVCRAPGVEFVDLPRAAIEIDFDLENSPAPVNADNVANGTHSGGPLLYMFGVRTTTRHTSKDGVANVRSRMRTFVDYTDTDDGEARVFADTWTYFQSVLAKAKKQRRSIKFYHYTDHEVHWCKRLAEKHAGKPGVPTVTEVEDFFNSGLVVDMYDILSTQMFWPTKSHSIKDLAKWSRFSWPMKNAGGDSSIVWYASAVTLDGSESQAMQDMLRDYNEADCEAQTHLRDWVCSLGAAREPGSRIPSVETLRKPLRPRSA